MNALIAVLNLVWQWSGCEALSFRAKNLNRDWETFQELPSYRWFEPLLWPKQVSPCTIFTCFIISGEGWCAGPSRTPVSETLSLLLVENNMDSPPHSDLLKKQTKNKQKKPLTKADIDQRIFTRKRRFLCLKKLQKHLLRGLWGGRSSSHITTKPHRWSGQEWRPPWPIFKSTEKSICPSKWLDYLGFLLVCYQPDLRKIM